MNSKKEFQKKQPNKETIRGDNVALKQTETKLTPTEVVMNYEECGTMDQSCEAGKVGDFCDGRFSWMSSLHVF